MTTGRTVLLLIALAVLWPSRLAASDGPPEGAVDYTRDIKPVLSKHCYACHGGLQQKAGLRLDTADLIKKGGDSGPAIEPRSSDDSLIIDAVTGKDGWRMPPESEGSPLSADEIAKIKAWIDQGAQSPAGEQPQPDPRRHWSFQPLGHPAVPSAAALGQSAAWIRNPIDAFLAVEHRKHGLKPKPAADPATLIRRVCLDLTGLVPTPQMVREFVADPSDRAYEALVDRLLASPEYGERWARHWMDVWRYSDWDGFGAEVRESQPHIWRWRDWIVESLNRDLPYDRMIVAMLAADETEPQNADSLRATGFLVRNWYKFNRNVWLDDTVEHTAKAFLGLTLNCAKCHDHKYDPIPQTDYYAFRAFFEPYGVRTDRLPGQPDTGKAGLVRVYDDKITPTFVFERGDEKRPIKGKPLAPSVPKVLSIQAKLEPIRTVALPPAAYYTGIHAFVREEAITQAQQAIAVQRAALVDGERALAIARRRCRGRNRPARRRPREKGPQGGRGRSSGARRKNRSRYRSLRIAAATDALQRWPAPPPGSIAERPSSGRRTLCSRLNSPISKPGTHPNSPARPRQQRPTRRRRSSKPARPSPQPASSRMTTHRAIRH